MLFPDHEARDVSTRTDSESWQLKGSQRDSQSITRDWQPFEQALIDGVVMHQTRAVLTGYGYLVELFRADWPSANAVVDQVFASCLLPGAISAWHAHEFTTDRLSVAQGTLRIALYDGRANSRSLGLVNEFRVSDRRPGLLTIPPKVWHGVMNIGDGPAILVNSVDRAYQYESPDHWRAPADTPEIPYSFPQRRAG